MAELDVAHGLTLRFRHLAGELRRASGHPNADREFERLLLRVSGALRDAFDTRRLPGLILDAVDQNKSGGLNLFWELQLALDVVGYWSPCEFIEPVEECDDGTLLGGHRAIFLEPGPISLAWPGVFDSILCEDRLSSDADVQAIFRTALVEQQFTIMGYYATACDLLADWIEENPTGSDGRGHYLDKTMRCDSAADVRVRLIILANQIAGFRDEDPGLFQMFQQMDYPEPGPDCSFDPDSRLLIWHGRHYSLTKNMAGVIGVLFKAWEKGRPIVSLDSIKNVVFASALNESLGKVFRRGDGSTDPVYDVIETVGQGLYRLADPPQS